MNGSFGALVPVILAGGQGRRLWPLSTPHYPKQFVLQVPSGHSLFKETVLRAGARAQFAPPVILTTASLERVVRSELAAIECHDATVLIEPVGRNTAPAIALAACHLATTMPDALMLVKPSDHIVHSQARFLEALEIAARAAQENHLVAFAVTPSAPETAYGYIAKGPPIARVPGAYGIAQYIEKPDYDRASAMLASGGYGWNSGMFVMRPHVALEQFTLHAPQILAAVKEAYAARHEPGGRSIHAQAQAFSRAPAISFDHAIMEKTALSAVVDADMGWRDMGSWAALDAASGMLFQA